MKTIITVTICIGLLVISGCESNYIWTPTAEESGQRKPLPFEKIALQQEIGKVPGFEEIGLAPEQKFFGYDIELIRQRLLSCQTREEFDQEVREINAELERNYQQQQREYQQQQMIDALRGIEFELSRRRQFGY